MRSRRSGCASILPISSYSLATISFGVPAGANAAYQPSTSKPGRPAGGLVGTCGAPAERFSLNVAKARSRPVFTYGMVDTRLALLTDTRPPIRSVMLGAVPLYGTCSILTPVRVLSSTSARCGGLPLPEDEDSNSSGCDPAT